MFKKILIPMLVFAGLTSMAFYPQNEEDDSPTTPVADQDYPSVVVLELFTSQGCSSCPPADVLLNKAKTDYPDQLFALSYHVDYWNYIGWEDPFSHPNYSKKQREYNRKFRYPSNYTPELVVNGKEHFVGSNSAKLRSKIKEYVTLRAPNEIVLGQVVRQGSTVTYDYRINGPITGKQLRAVLVLDERTTVVTRGENRNRTLKNSNIVVSENYLDVSASSGQGTIKLPNGIGSHESIRLMVLMENDDLDITAAAKAAI